MKNKKVGCQFCGCLIKSIETNNGSAIGLVIKKQSLIICRWCNDLEIMIRINYLKRLRLKEIFEAWFIQQDNMTKFQVKKWKPYFNDENAYI